MLCYATFSLNQTCFQLFREDHRKRKETEEYHDRCRQSATCVANIEVLKDKYPDVQLCFTGKYFYMLVVEADYNICHVLKLQDGLNYVYNRFRF